MTNGWTGGQYGVFRAICGAYLLVHFAMLLPYGTELFSRDGVLPDGGVSPLLRLFPNVLAIADTPAAVTTLLVVAMAASVAFAIGLRDRAAALATWYVLACLVGRNPLIANPALPFIGWLLIAHACLPHAPFLSVAARGRVDPRGGWHFPPVMFGAAWVVMAVAYSYSGWTKLGSPSWVDGSALSRVLANPLSRPGGIGDLVESLPGPLLRGATWAVLGLELLYAPLALASRMRPWIWLAMVLLHCGLLLVIDFADLTCGMLVFHLFTFDPAWIPAARRGTTDTVFYDGTCGLCHGAVRFCLAEDRSATAFRFAPLGGESFSRRTPGPAGAVDSIVVLTAAGETLVRSRAILHLLARLGGLWRALAVVAGVVPRPIRDAAYDAVARVRYRIFGRRAEACPLLPPDLKSRFVA